MKSLLHPWTVAVVAAALDACGTSSSVSLGSATVTGQVSGYSADFTNVVAVISPSGSSTAVYFTTIPNGCDATSHIISANATTMEIYISGTQPQTYEFSYQNYGMGEAFFHVMDGDGQDVLYKVIGSEILNAADSGTIALHDVTTSTVDGTLDMTFPEGHLIGSFTAADCSSEANGG
ncbi:MAG TPA: hypothetical protein VFQ65_07535 [Kofleriaceae bacterium]|nr:hypothetical protein [Kofleriaceae bacterium]